MIIDKKSQTPVFRQIYTQLIDFIKSSGIGEGEPLPIAEKVAEEMSVPVNAVIKAYRLLEVEGFIHPGKQGNYEVAGIGDLQNRYQARGVSSSKKEVHQAVDRIDAGLYPKAFCKVNEDFFSGDPERCCIIHSDGSGTKSLLAYLHYRETGDPAIFRGIAQDSIVMNIDDIYCVGPTGRVLLSNTVNRNSITCPGEVIRELIEGSEAF
ncbi:MAG: GntR family transcriptional regulator, partial [Planctomycetes bacterium]|nr:GntR family transcriptional regulator [Planctomycetota bacterium]